jgi:hypothetical protein
MKTLIKIYCYIKNLCGSKFGKYFYIPRYHRKHIEDAAREAFDRGYYRTRRPSVIRIHQETYEQCESELKTLAEKHEFGNIVKIVKTPQCNGYAVCTNGTIMISWEPLQPEEEDCIAKIF